MNIIIWIIIFIIISFVGGIVRLCIFGNFSLEEALIAIIIGDIMFAILFIGFEIFSVNEESTRDTIFLIALIPYIIVLVLAERIIQKKNKDGQQ